MSDLKIIDGNEDSINEYERKIDKIAELTVLHDKWRAYYNKLIKECEDVVSGEREISQDELRKLCFVGVKQIALKCEIRNRLLALGELQTTEESVKMDFWAVDVMLTLISGLTPRNLMIAFPITKDFDGKRWGWKDYFFTIDEINKLDMDNQIGKETMIRLLVDYQNPLLEELFLESFKTMSDYNRLQFSKPINAKKKSDLKIIK